jgi:micrococcal nuclease
MKRTWRLAAALLLLAAGGCARAGNFAGIVTHVTDGDSLWVRPVAGGPPRQVRLLGIDAPEICQRYGPQARDALAAQVLHRQVRVKSRKRDTYQRTLGQVSVDGRDLGQWMVSRGHAWSYRFHRDQGPYAPQEAQARTARLGLWGGPAPLPPRDFRQRHGSCK